MKYGWGYALITRINWYLGRTVLHYRKTEMNIICDYLNNEENIKILDYGCNTGYLLNIIKEKYLSKKFHLFGADINLCALNYARKKYKELTFFEINNEFFDKERFDVIILSHVLEHIKERDKLITNLKRLMKNNGTLIIAVPQERIRGDCSLIQILYNLLRFRFENPHVVKINDKDLSELLRNNELYIKEKTYTHFFYPFKSDKRRIDSWSLIVKVKMNDH